jgi:hypothetical protein
MSKKAKIIAGILIIIILIGGGVFGYLVYTGRVKLSASQKLKSSSPSGWQQTQTISGATELFGIAGHDNDVWVCGKNNNNQGIVAHFDGSTWSEAKVISGSTYLTKICITNSDKDVWACGVNNNNQGIVVHYDGSTWSEAKVISGSTYLSEIYNNSPGNYLLISGNNWNNGQKGVVAQYEGSTIGWKQTQTYSEATQLSGITGFASNIWACGFKYLGSEGQGQLHGNGVVINVGSRQVAKNYPGYNLSSIHGDSNDIWVCGYNGDNSQGIVAHYDGKAWSNAQIISGTNELKSLTGQGNDVWTCGTYSNKGVVSHYNGSVWDAAQVIPNTSQLNDITGFDKDVWACGISDYQNPKGVVVHYTGKPVTPSSYNFSVRAKARCYNGCPKMRISTDGKQIADVEVKNTKAYTNYTFKTNSKPKRIDVHFYNDNGSRDLLVDSITFDGKKIDTCENVRVNYWIPGLNGSTKCGLKVPKRTYKWNKDPMGMAWPGILQFFLDR